QEAQPFFKNWFFWVYFFMPFFSFYFHGSLITKKSFNQLSFPLVKSGIMFFCQKIRATAHYHAPTNAH
ncbi:hypothetical protein, partial [Neobacillus niacini]|uniref:hypothetical protein n=1 Tax=Neobacillus niacini TaxID=86668 RepID=UPI001EE71FC3